MERVGVRELRQNLSVYLRRVRSGESLEVTERGRPVAVLQPITTDDAVAALAGNLAELPEPLPRQLERPLSQVVEDLRQDRV
jgi:prevent-host-death family protein